MWRKWRTLHLQRCYHGHSQSAAPLPNRETNCHLTQNFVVAILLEKISAAHLDHIGQIFMVLQMHGVFDEVLAYMLHRRDLGGGVTYAQSAYQPSVAAFHIQSLSMFFLRSVTMSRLSSPLGSNFTKERKKAPKGPYSSPCSNTELLNVVTPRHLETEDGQIPKENPSKRYQFLVLPYEIQRTL